MPVAAMLMKEKINKSSNICFAEHSVKMMSSINEACMEQLELLAN